MILARHAEATFWAGRYLERVEHTTRMLDVATRDSMYFASADGPEWRRLLEVAALSKDFDVRSQPATGANVARYLVLDNDNHGSVASSVRLLRENIRTVRDRVPVELWEEANRLHLSLDDLSATNGGPTWPAEPFELYSTVRRRCQALSGIIAESMPRDEAFDFLVIGAMIERAIACCRTVRFLVLNSNHSLDESSVLRTLSSLQAYRRSTRQRGDVFTLAAFLILADDIPRTVLWCLRRVDGRIQSLLQRTSTGLVPAATVCGRVRSQLEYGNVEAELRTDSDVVLDRLESELRNVAAAIADYAFDPAQIPAMQSQFIRPGTDQ